MAAIWWMWALLALLFLVAEIFVRGYVALGVALGAVVAAVLAYLGVTVVGQLIAFAVVAVLAFFVSRPLVTGRRTYSENVFGTERLVGKEAIVTIPIDPDRGHGRVLVEREEWPAESETAQPIADGTRVQVVAVEKTRLRVRPLPNERLAPRSPARRPEWS